MTISEIIIYSSLAGVAMFLGTLLVLYFEKWVEKNSIFLISFAAGVMLTIAFNNLIPEASELFEKPWLWVFAGFIGLYVVQEIFMFHPCHEEVCEAHHLGMFSFVGLGLHSFLDGVIIAVGFEAGTALGLLTTLAVILHKMPDGITITSILLHTKTPRRKTVLLSSIVALATPLGALIAFFFLRGVPQHVLGILVALTAGSFIYLAAADLLPETHKMRHRANALFFFIGVAIIILVDTFFHH